MRRKIGRAALVLTMIAGVLMTLAGVALPGWAGWNDILQAGLTATPTRTPRPVTPEPDATAVDLTVLAPATLAPAGRGAPTAQVAASDALPPYLVPVVARYGLDPSRRFVVVDPNQQRMTLWEPHKPLREMPISTGDESQGWRTAAWYGLIGSYMGTFHTGDIYADDAWYLFRDAGDILIHSAPYRIVDGSKQYEALDALGSYPASKGCIRLRPEDARWFTAWDPQGVPLVILPSSKRSVVGS